LSGWRMWLRRRRMAKDFFLQSVARRTRNTTTNNRRKFIVHTTYQDFRRCYMKGKHSLYENALHPPVEWLDEDHSYTSPESCVADLISHEIDIDEQWSGSFDEHVAALVDVDCVWSSNRGRTILSQEKEVHRGKHTLTLYITLWSGDFEPHSTKDNRGSIWVMTITIAAPHDNYHTTYNTYVVSIGKKGVDHTPVYDRVMVDLKELVANDKINAYYNKAGGHVRVSAGLNNELSDQPKKRSSTGTRAGNTNYSGQYGKSIQA
jgi:hypothetical protein